MLAVPAARAAHPLLTDDPGLQGAGHWQLEVNTDHARTRDGGATFWARQVNTTLTRGMTDQVDIAFNLPLQRQTAPGEPTQSGVGDVGLQLKWRFYDNGQGWALGVRPTLTLPTGSTRKSATVRLPQGGSQLPRGLSRRLSLQPSVSASPFGFPGSLA